jgi:YD repeat-containing protein
LPAGAHAAQTVAYTYDAAGRLTSATYDDTLATVFTYDLNGNILSIETAPVSTSAPEPPGGSALPATFALGPSAPNPHRDRSTLHFQLPRTSAVLLEVYDAGGRRVRTVINGVVPAGYHRATWDGRTGQGRSVPSGVYFVRFAADGFTESRAISVLR